MDTTIPVAEDAGFDVDIGFDDDDYGQVDITFEVIVETAYDLGLERYLLPQPPRLYAA